MRIMIHEILLSTVEKFLLGILVVVAWALTSPAQARLAPGFEIFEAHDEASLITIDYQSWDIVLRSTILPAGPTSRHPPRFKRLPTGTRIPIGNANPSWLEGNRVLFHLLEDTQINAVSQYRRELEALPERYPLENLSRDEQLAFWINLYNMTVYEQVALRYPITSLRRLRLGAGKTGSLWDEKLLNVAGVALSLNDIQNNILIPIWNSPLVLYGLFQGSVGGPSLRMRAYKPDSVWKTLGANAREFINSIRGVHRRGSVARISRLYEWGGSAFPDWEKDVRDHLMAYADEETAEILTMTKRIEAGYYDWYIADLYNGRLKWVSIYSNTVSDLSGSVTSMETGLPPHVAAYLDGLRLKNKMLGYSRGRVYIEDILLDEDETTTESAESPEPEE